MGLPVGRIMEEVEHELRHMDDELSDEVDVNMEVEEEADDNMEVEDLVGSSNFFRKSQKLTQCGFVICT